MKKLILIIFAIYAITAYAHEGCGNPAHQQQEEETPFISGVEPMPQYPGGQTEMKKFIAQNLKYPEIDKKNGIEGRVIVRFIVSKTGKIENIVVMKGVTPTLNQEAVRVISLMPDWIPGKQNGESVPVYYVIPISFYLGEEQQK